MEGSGSQSVRFVQYFQGCSQIRSGCMLPGRDEWALDRRDPVTWAESSWTVKSEISNLYQLDSGLGVAEEVHLLFDSRNIYSGLWMGGERKNLCTSLEDKRTQCSRCPSCITLGLGSLHTSLASSCPHLLVTWGLCLRPGSKDSRPEVLGNCCPPSCGLQPKTGGNWCLHTPAPSPFVQDGAEAYTLPWPQSSQ